MNQRTDHGSSSVKKNWQPAVFKGETTSNLRGLLALGSLLLSLLLEVLFERRGHVDGLLLPLRVVGVDNSLWELQRGPKYTA